MTIVYKDDDFYTQMTPAWIERDKVSDTTLMNFMQNFGVSMVEEDGQWIAIVYSNKGYGKTHRAALLDLRKQLINTKYTYGDKRKS